MANPEFSDKDGKLQAKFWLGYDGDKDQKMAASISLVVEVDKIEALNEAIGAILKNESLPQWLKDILKGMDQPVPPAA